MEKGGIKKSPSVEVKSSSGYFFTGLNLTNQCKLQLVMGLESLYHL